MSTLKKYWPMIVTLLGALGPVLSPAVQAFYASHASSVGVAAGIWATFKWLLPSPFQPK